MKKLLLMIAAVVCTVAVNAQDTKVTTTTTTPAATTQQAAQANTHPQMWMFLKAGKVYYSADGKMQVLDKDMILENGSTLKPTGEIVMKDGSSTKMKEGDRINKAGEVRSPQQRRMPPAQATPPTPAPATK